MTYCTFTDLVERFGAIEINQLTNQEGPCPAVDSAINDAAAEIDSYVATRYTLPLAGGVPPVLTRCACEMARYYLWDDKATDHVRERYEDAIRILKGISNGSITLPISSEDTPTEAAASVGVLFTTTPKKWGGPI